MNRKTALITGSTDGIGYQTALNLADKNWQILVHGRSATKVSKAAENIKQKTGNKRIYGVWGDLSSLKEVQNIPKQVKEITDGIDVLLNNAGVIMPAYRSSADGYEMTFAVNHLAHFYLTGLLLPVIRERGRIINVSSQVHSQSLSLQRLNDPGFFSSIDAYADSKMCNVLFTYALDRQLNGIHGITVNCLHPGVVNTKMLVQTWGRVGIPVEEGADNTVFVATSEEAGRMSGQYFVNRQPRKSAAASYDHNLQDELWEMSLNMIRKAGFELSDPAFTGNNG